MARALINQSVDVYSIPPAADQIGGVTEGEEHVHSFENLIPACEFAVSLASEGHGAIRLQRELEGALNLEQAQQIVQAWHLGRAALDAESIEY